MSKSSQIHKLQFGLGNWIEPQWVILDNEFYGNNLSQIGGKTDDTFSCGVYYDCNTSELTSSGSITTTLRETSPSTESKLTFIRFFNVLFWRGPTYLHFKMKFRWVTAVTDRKLDCLHYIKSAYNPGCVIFHSFWSRISCKSTHFPHLWK